MLFSSTRISGSGSGGGGGAITLETNGATNGDQNLLNLVNGTNVTITDNGAGSVTINSTGAASLSAHLVGFGSNTGTLTGNSYFSYFGTGTFDVGWALPLGNWFEIDAPDQYVLIGDNSNAFNGTNIAILDASQNITAKAAHSFFYEDTASNKYLSLSPQNFVYAIGDLSGAKNSTVLSLNDSLESLVFSQGGNKYLSLDVTNGLYSMGDTATVGQGTKIEIDDPSKSVAIRANDTFEVTDSGANQYLLLNIAAGRYTLGDIGVTHLGTQILIDATTNILNSNGKWDFSSNLLTNVTDPVSAQDAATKAYVDSIASNNLNWHNAVVVATAAALPANTYNNGASGVGATLTANANGALTVDGVVVSNGDRLLIKNEVTLANNGIYIVTATGSGGAPYVLTRTTDADTPARLTRATVTVTSGTTNNNTAWTNTTVTVTVGTTAVTFVNILNTIYTAGAGLTLTGHVFSLDATHANVWSGLQTFDSGFFNLAGATSGFFSQNAAAITSTYGITWPAAQGASGTTIVNNGSGVLSWGNAGALLKTNGTTNSTQTLLNLVAGTNITLSEIGGAVTITATGGGGSTSIDSLTAATLNTITAGASITFDGNNGTIQTVTLNQATALTLANLKVGIPYTFIVKQDSTGSRTLTWSTTVHGAYGAGGTPPISTTANSVDKYSIVSDGTTIYVDTGLAY